LCSSEDAFWTLGSKLAAVCTVPWRRACKASQVFRI